MCQYINDVNHDDSSHVAAKKLKFDTFQRPLAAKVNVWKFAILRPVLLADMENLHIT